MRRLWVLLLVVVLGAATGVARADTPTVEYPYFITWIDFGTPANQVYVYDTDYSIYRPVPMDGPDDPLATVYALGGAYCGGELHFCDAEHTFIAGDCCGDPWPSCECEIPDPGPPPPIEGYPTYEETWYRAGNTLPLQYQTALFNGAQDWDNVTGQCHDFEQVSPGEADFYVLKESIDGADGVIAQVTFLSSHNPERMSFDLEAWNTDVESNPGSNEYDFWAVATHEFGHTLELYHAPWVATDSMYNWIDEGEIAAREPSSRDMDGIRDIYPC